MIDKLVKSYREIVNISEELGCTIKECVILLDLQTCGGASLGEMAIEFGEGVRSQLNTLKKGDLVYTIKGRCGVSGRIGSKYFVSPSASATISRLCKV